MKTSIHCLLLVLFFWSGSMLYGQQIPISYSALFRPGLWNPASVGSKDFSRFFLAHQQRHVGQWGWKSIGDYINFSSSPQGKKGTFGFGFNLNNETEHTENRFGLSFLTSAKVITTKTMRLSAGISFGLINWNSSYDQVRIFDRSDVLLVNRSNFLELDAGMGIDLALKRKGWDVQAGVTATQLPGNLVSSQLIALKLYPHVIAGGYALYEIVHNVRVGPNVFYRNGFFKPDNNIQAGKLDLGLKLDFKRQNLWLGANYRHDRSALTAAFGCQVYVSDSARHPQKNALIVNLNGGVAYPFRQAAAFGPSAEIGLDIIFGREFKYRRGGDSLRFVTGSFWVTDGNLNTHLESRLAPNGPVGLRGTTYVTNKNVTLTYEFPDAALQYMGTTPEIKGDTLYELGQEWIGVDGFLEGIVDEVIAEALTPDTLKVKNAEVLEPLENIIFIELASLLKASEAEAFLPAEGMVYEGELGTNNSEEDTLYLSVVYNNADTIVGVALNHYLTNLELACLKMYSMRKKLQKELNDRYGDEMAFLVEGDKFDPEDVVGKKLVNIRKPRILPNHPNQEAFQINQVKVKFSRYTDSFVEDADEKEADPDELLILDEPKRKRRENPGRFRDKR
jgi:Type IX secretion system membrane protein PorP/SprF